MKEIHLYCEGALVLINIIWINFYGINSLILFINFALKNILLHFISIIVQQACH